MRRSQLPRVAPVVARYAALPWTAAPAAGL